MGGARGPRGMEHEVTLRGRHVTLEPLRPEHAQGLADAIAPDDDVYRWTSTSPRGALEMLAWIADRRAGGMAFAMRAPDGRLMGSTSLFGIDARDRCAEIGHTWIAAPFRRTGANTEAKLLLLTHGFERMGLARIQLVTDARNVRSRDAIARIGATFEGILRNHRWGYDGKLRESAYFSFVDREWPERKAALEAKLR